MYQPFSHEMRQVTDTKNVWIQAQKLIAGVLLEDLWCYQALQTQFHSHCFFQIQ